MARYFENFNSTQYPNTYMGYLAAGELAVHAVSSVTRTITEAVATRRRAAQLQAALDGIENCGRYGSTSGNRNTTSGTIYGLGRITPQHLL